MKQLLVIFLLFIDRHIIHFIEDKEIAPDENTNKSLNFLTQLVTEADKRGVKFWITGSWGLTILAGRYFKQLNDIDLTTKNSEVSKLSTLLLELGYRKGQPKWPDMHFFKKDNIEVEFFSVEDKNHLFSSVHLADKKVNFMNYSYRVLSTDTLYEKYLLVFLHKKRNAKADLIKLKILSALIEKSLKHR